MASLLLGDLNDYLEPGQACIVPASELPAADGAPPAAVSINLTDCLACSGCITSAESVLVAQQTYSKLLDALAPGLYGEVAVSVAPQPVAALATHFGLELQAAWRRLNWFLKHVLGVARVLDISAARALTLRKLAEEYDAAEARGEPLIVSACPGWVCYAEKRYAEFLPLLSRTRSPQQMAGVLVKHYLSPHRRPADIFHCTLMPCFDKKLEASRDDFLADVVGRTRDVDTVITTTELLQVFAERLPGVPFADFAEDTACAPLQRHTGSGSGGYLAHILAHATRGRAGTLVTVPGRNADSTEYHLVSPAGEVLLRFAAVSGFKNIQTFVIRHRKPPARTAAPYAFVEIMACPGGCLNGGGQPRPDDASRSGARLHSDRVDSAYHAAPVLAEEPALVQDVLQWAGQDPARSRLFSCSYQAVQETKATAINVQW